MCCRLARQQDGSAGCSPSPFPAHPWLFLQRRNIVLPMPWFSKGTGMDQINESSFLMIWKGAGSQGLGGLWGPWGWSHSLISCWGTQSLYLEQR